MALVGYIYRGRPPGNHLPPLQPVPAGRPSKLTTELVAKAKLEAGHGEMPASEGEA